MATKACPRCKTDYQLAVAGPNVCDKCGFSFLGQLPTPIHVPAEDEEAAAFAVVAAERCRQMVKWGQQDHDDGKWLKILSEEVGEAAKASLEGNDERLRREVTHIAAVAVAWKAALLRKRFATATFPSRDERGLY